MNLLHGFFEIIGILVTFFFVLGALDVVDFSLRIGPVGMNAKIRAALAKEQA